MKVVLGCAGGDGRPGGEQIPARRVPAVDLRAVNGRMGQPRHVGCHQRRLLRQRPMARPNT